MGNRKRNKKKKRVFDIFPVLLLLVGFGILCYPAVSNSLNRIYQADVVEDYLNKVVQAEDADREAILAEAENYNRQLSLLGAPLADYEDITEEYHRVLDVAGSGVMGVVTIPGIGVELPICHGTEGDVLKRAAGHLEGSSLPVGGEGTHAVISAHRGLPGAKLFTKLDEVQVGDLFTITILDQKRTYCVDQIVVVLPEEMEMLYAVEGKEYVTLMTCTPYGINSHRLLVRGIRTEDIGEAAEAVSNPESVGADILILLVGIPVLFVLLAAALLIYRKKPAESDKIAEEENEIRPDRKTKRV